MKKLFIWLGAILLIVGVLLVFLSGSQNPTTLEPTIPALANTSQVLWTGMAIVGLLLLVISLFLRKK